MNRREFLLSAPAVANASTARRPNIIFVFADDLGYADLGCYGGEIRTPHLDRLAAEGVRFTQAYVASPICSPSRVGAFTGQHPSRHLIFSYLTSRQRQKELGMRDWLGLSAPNMACTFKRAGYATGHFGKWHMGGGRDVGDAPLPTEYGFDESFVSFVGLGDRVLFPAPLSTESEKLGRGRISHARQDEVLGVYVGRAIEFVKRNQSKPFYLQLWPNEVHDPFAPKPELMKKYDRFSSNKYVQQYYAMLDEMDRQIGRLVDFIDARGLGRDTLFVFASDNGPTAWPRYYKEGFEPPGRTAGLRGRKWSLYEGGVRVPMIARWKGRIPGGRTDETSIVSTLDLLPTLCALAGVKPPPGEFDGEDMSQALIGKPRVRSKDLFWEYGRDATYLYPGKEEDRSPSLAVRSGRWKLLANYDGSRNELYDFSASQNERKNVEELHPAVSRRLKERLVAWRRSLPAL